MDRQTPTTGGWQTEQLKIIAVVVAAILVLTLTVVGIWWYSSGSGDGCAAVDLGPEMFQLSSGQHRSLNMGRYADVGVKYSASPYY